MKRIIAAVAVAVIAFGCSEKAPNGPDATVPVITTQPASQSVNVSATATFFVSATGTAPISYVWQKNNTTIAGATDSAYTTPATLLADSGSTYRCIATNSAGSDTSTSAILTVATPVPVGTVKLMGATYTVSGDTLTSVATMDSCDGTTLVSYTETSKDIILVSGDTLYVTEVGQSDPMVFTRVGTGTGLQGEWKTTFNEYGLSGDAFAVVSSSTISYYVSKSLGNDYVKLVVSLFATMDTSAFSIDSSVADKLILTGKKTGEKITVAVNDKGSAVWTSDKVGREATTIDFIVVTTCTENDGFPAWFMLFIEENAGGAAAKRGVPSLPSIKDLF